MPEDPNTLNDMKRLLMGLLFAGALCANAQAQEKDFVKGADVGFLAGQERHGVKFHDRNGNDASAWNCSKTTIR